MNKYLKLLLIGLLGITLVSCGGDDKEKAGGDDYASKQQTPTIGDWVIIHELSDASNLNPITSNDASATQINELLFQSLLIRSSQNYELIPQLAVAPPKISEDGLSYEFEIKPEAVWDDGNPITGYDFEFTVKAIKNPLVDCANLRPYLEFIVGVETDKENPKKFKVLTDRKYFRAEDVIGTLQIIPKHLYDKEGLMDEFSIEQLTKQGDKLRTNEKIKKFAEDFNSEKYKREVFYGSGPYKFKTWETGQYILVERKDNWWGDKLKDIDKTEGLVGYPKKVYFKTINDYGAAIVALKGQKLDVMHGVPSKQFLGLKKSKKINKHFNLYTPPLAAYSYIGLNNRPPDHRIPFFTDKRVRKAIAHIVDVDKIIEKFTYGMSERIIGPVSPLIKGAYHDGLKPIAYNLEEAKKLLKEAGWEDTDGDGILDKEIEGKRVPFSCEFMVNAGNDVRKNIALLVKEEAKKVGIEIKVKSLEWSTYLEKIKKHDFDMYYQAWVSPSPTPPDLKQIWHTSSYEGGGNYIGFGFTTPESDKIIEEIRQTLDEEKRNQLYRKFQEILYEEMPCVFLTSGKNKIVIHKRFRGVYVSANYPGYKVNTFWTPQELILYKD